MVLSQKTCLKGLARFVGISVEMTAGLSDSSSRYGTAGKTSKPSGTGGCFAGHGFSAAGPCLFDALQPSASPGATQASRDDEGSLFPCRATRHFGRSIVMSRFSLRASILTAAVSSALALATHATPITADGFTYSPGDAPANYQNSANALGNLNGNTGFGGLNPYNPAFSTNDLVWVGQGGSLTLHLSAPIAPNGFNLGVYSNVGLNEAPGGDGTSTNPAANFNQPSIANVSVSQDGVHFTPLNGGNPITFANPTNYYTDTPIVNNFQTLGTQHAGQSKPFLQGLSAFNGATYDQLKSTLNNSVGGTWLNVSNTVPSAINYVKFDVAANSGNRMIVDAIGGLGAVNTLTPGGRVISESVGTGPNTSDVLVDFGSHQYDFQVHYATANINVEQALQLVQANTDFRFSIIHYSFGDLLNSIDYAGYIQTNDPNDFNKYWAEYIGDGTGQWTYGNGISADTLTNGQYAGFSWNPENPGGPNFAIVPEPTIATFGVLSLLLIQRRRRR